MRAATFKVWGSLPSKLINNGLGVVGLWATVKPELASALFNRMTTPEQMRLIGLASFAVGLAYWVIWLLLKPSAVSASAASPTVQTNQGAHSTTVHGEFHGNVYINDPNQGRAVEPQKKRPMEISENMLRMASNVPPLEPDMVLTALLMRLYKIMGPVPTSPDAKKKFQRRINLEIADKVLSQHLIVWGRIGDMPLREIARADLKYAVFDHIGQKMSVSNSYDANSSMIFTDIKFNREQIDRVWPDVKFLG